MKALVYHGAGLCLLLLVYNSVAGQNINNKCGKTVSIYLTFDDGPMETSQFLDSVLIRDSILVEVFVVGYRVAASETMRQRLEMYRQNTLVEIGNHSYSHASGHYRSFYTDHAQVVNDIIKNAGSLDLANHLVRLPGRNTWRINGRKRTDMTDANAAADSLDSLGYKLVGWDLEWKIDTCKKRYSSANEMMGQIKYAIQAKRLFEEDHVVILCHDWALSDQYFRDELALFIRKIKEAGCITFAHLSSYPGINSEKETGSPGTFHTPNDCNTAK